jgi:hypothetical protein
VRWFAKYAAADVARVSAPAPIWRHGAPRRSWDGGGNTPVAALGPRGRAHGQRTFPFRRSAAAWLGCPVPSASAKSLKSSARRRWRAWCPGSRKWLACESAVRVRRGWVVETGGLSIQPGILESPRSPFSKNMRPRYAYPVEPGISSASAVSPLSTGGGRDGRIRPEDRVVATRTPNHRNRSEESRKDGLFQAGTEEGSRLGGGATATPAAASFTRQAGCARRRGGGRRRGA